jgi:hypothetical protein
MANGELPLLPYYATNPSCNAAANEIMNYDYRMMGSSERTALRLTAYCSMILFSSLSCSTAFVLPPPRASLMATAEAAPTSHYFWSTSSSTAPISRNARNRNVLMVNEQKSFSSSATESDNINDTELASTSKTNKDKKDKTSASQTKTTTKKKKKASGSSSSSSSTPTTVKYLFENYNKPIVLLGLSSSPTNNELQRLALSLSGALVGNNAKKLQDTLDLLQRSQGVGLLGDDDNDDDDDDMSNNSNNHPSSSSDDNPAVTGISLSTIGLDDEGPFVLDAELIRDLIREKTLSLTTGVIVIDFNHAAFGLSKEYEVDLIRALGMVAKELYEDEKLLSVYVNVQPDGTDGTIMSDDVKERRHMIEKEVLIAFSDYELCIKNEGMLTEKETSTTWKDMEWELQRIIARALLPPPVVGGTGSTAPNNNADLVMGRNTFFLSLSFPQVEDASPYVEQMCHDVDSMEYRVDLLSAAKDYLSMKTNADSCSSDDPRFDILYQQQRLRALCRPHAQR